MIYSILFIIILVLSFFVVLLLKKKSKDSGFLKITNLSKKRSAQLLQLVKSLNDNIKEVKITESPLKGLVYVLKFKGGLKAEGVENLREEVSAILNMARIEKPQEVVIKLDSPGGTVTGYGLAASQIARLRDQNIPVTVAIDQVAASGGYMMASVANKVISAPFAIIGSVGVVLEFPNFTDLLKKFGVKYEQYTAGQYKRTVSPMVEPSEEGKEKTQQKLEATLELFKKHIKKYRPQVDVEHIATGETWYGEEAKEKSLVDEILTYDDYLTNKMQENKVLLLQYQEPQKNKSKIASILTQAINGVLDHWVKKMEDYV